MRRWIFWPHAVRGWWATLEHELEPADLYHACGSLTIAAALRIRAHARIGPAGRRAAVIYDAIDDVFESNNVLDMPRPLRAWHSRRETGWAHASDAIITVNEALAERLAGRWHLASPPAVVPNYPEIPDHAGAPVAAGSGLLRAELELAPEARVILFQGRLGPRLGLEAAAEAVLLVPSAVLVLLGFGRWFELERARDREPRFLGRHFTVAARHPDELLAWTASADLAVIPLPPVSINQRLSSPNKFWEAIAAGTPVVVPAELTYMAELVRAATSASWRRRPARATWPRQSPRASSGSPATPAGGAGSRRSPGPTTAGPRPPGGIGPSSPRWPSPRWPANRSLRPGSGLGADCSAQAIGELRRDNSRIRARSKLAGRFTGFRPAQPLHVTEGRHQGVP